jgi:2-polyprenyl-3-methyl-5-hydroxy-6-metoxy-1,4-benzoquinol methylase
MLHVKTEDADYRHIKQSYDQGSDDYSGHFKQPHDFIDPERHEFIRQLPIGSHILDCVCGPGMDTEKFFHLGYQVTAIDLSQRFVRRTQTRVPGAIVRRHNLNGEELPMIRQECNQIDTRVLNECALPVTQTGSERQNQ